LPIACPISAAPKPATAAPATIAAATGRCRWPCGTLQSPIFDAFQASAAAAGHRLVDDLNGPDAVGIGRLDSSKGGGRRCSTAVAYLRPALARPNLTLHTGALAQRVLVEGGRATGIDYVQAGQPRRALATREVILCGGAINTPQLLMLSGIGPADELRQHGIRVVLDQPGIGANLQDHLDLGMSFRCSQPVSHAWMGSPSASCGWGWNGC
jgi:choline dehydrogenase